MKHLRISGSPHTAAYTVTILGENRPHPAEDTHDTVMQILRLKMRWDLQQRQQQDNQLFDSHFPISF